jgi:DNA-binding beta-propeller fold protein YncE
VAADLVPALAAACRLAFLRHRGRLARAAEAPAPSGAGGALQLGEVARPFLPGGPTPGLSDTVASDVAPIALEPWADERLVEDRHWVDGRRTRLYRQAHNTAHLRLVHLDEAARPLTERWIDSGNRWPRAPRMWRLQDPQGRVRVSEAYEFRYDDDDGLVGAVGISRFASLVSEPEAGLRLRVRAFSLDAGTRVGTYTHEEEASGLQEVGKVAAVPDLFATMAVPVLDPLGALGGEAEVSERGGRRVYVERQRPDGDGWLRELETPGGLKLSMRAGRAAPRTSWTGEVTRAGTVLGTVALVVGAAGSVGFTVGLRSDAAHPLEVGFGRAQEPPPVGPPAPLPRLVTLAGGREAGFADGTGGLARLAGVSALKASTVVPGRFYCTEFDNHRVRVLRYTGGDSAEVATLAGGDEAVTATGTLAQARFEQPAGLVVLPGADGGEQLYVADVSANVVRRLEVPRSGPGLTDVLAGDGTNGLRDGAAAQARFQLPYGLVLDPARTRLYVSDLGAHQVRVVDMASSERTVSTLAGGLRGEVDGPAGEARFDLPSRMAIGGDGRLWIIDAGNDALRVVDLKAASPRVQTVLRAAGPDEVSRDGSFEEARFGGKPISVVVLADGRLLVSAGREVRLLDPERRTVRTLLGTVTDERGDGPLDVAGQSSIVAMEPLPDGEVLLAEMSRLRVIRPAPGRSVLGP